LNNHFSFEGLKVLTCSPVLKHKLRVCLKRQFANIPDGDFGCVKFIKQVAAEYDFSIAATKAMFSNS
jgi:hypothetical protein